MGLRLLLACACVSLWPSRPPRRSDCPRRRRRPTASRSSSLSIERAVGEPGTPRRCARWRRPDVRAGAALRVRPEPDVPEGHAVRGQGARPRAARAGGVPPAARNVHRARDRRARHVVAPRRRAAAAPPARGRSRDVERLTIVSGLFRLALDATTEYDVKNLVITRARSDADAARRDRRSSRRRRDGPTAVVLLGRGRRRVRAEAGSRARPGAHLLRRRGPEDGLRRRCSSA